MEACRYTKGCCCSECFLKDKYYETLLNNMIDLELMRRGCVVPYKCDDDEFVSVVNKCKTLLLIEKLRTFRIGAKPWMEPRKEGKRDV